jgi:hypothetical protein
MLHDTYLQMTATVETHCENIYNKENSSANRKGTMHVCIFVNKHKGMSELKMLRCCTLPIQSSLRCRQDDLPIHQKSQRSVSSVKTQTMSIIYTIITPNTSKRISESMDRLETCNLICSQIMSQCTAAKGNVLLQQQLVGSCPTTRNHIMHMTRLIW